MAHVAVPEENQTWGGASALTWGDLLPHQWLCFRLAISEPESQMSVQGVVVKTSKVTSSTSTRMTIRNVKDQISSTVMSNSVEMLIGTVMSERDYYSFMRDYLPWYEKDSVVFNEILRAYDKPFRHLEEDLEILDRNMFIETTIEGLGLLERDLGIESIEDLQYDQRRAQIINQMLSSFDQTTLESIKSAVSAYSNGEVEVGLTLVEETGTLEIRFLGLKGEPNNLDGLKKVLDTIIPAHLGIDYVFTYNTWGMVRHLTWDFAGTMTWEEFRTTELEGSN